ncbi:MAG: hypothetical protein R3B72_17915 [Polyangiaceae bacterium]
MPDESIAASRFSVEVPGAARLNLGRPILDDEEPVFGYNGFSIQSSTHLLIDVNKVTLYQTGTSAMWQVGAQWLQYSNGNMFMASTANNTVAADNRLTVAAGAGHGQITSLDRALPHVTPRLESYNNLSLHYRVDEVHLGLKELMYGATGGVVAKMPQDAQLMANALGMPSYTMGSDGVLPLVHEMLTELSLSPAAATAMLEPLEWTGDHWEGLGTTSVYPMLNGFDPYGASGYNPASPVSLILAGLTQITRFMQRFVDLMRRVGPAITDNFVGARIERLISIWGHAQEAGHTTLNIADLARYNRSTGHTEFGSEEESRNFQARYEGSQGTFGSTRAQLTILQEPLDLSAVPPDQLYLEIRDREGGEPTRVDLGLPARLTIGVVLTSLPAPLPTGEQLVVTLDGTDVVIPLESFATAPDDSAAASALSARLEGHGVATDHMVTITSVATGPSAMVRVSGTPVALAAVNLASFREERGRVATTLEEIRAKLVGHGDYSIGDDGVVKHGQTGEESFLEVTGPAAGAVFGANPARSRGADPDLRNFAAVRSLQFEIAKWPEDLRNQWRPIYQAFGDVVAVWGHIKGIVDDLFAIAGLPQNPPSRVGLIAQEGVSIASGGPLFAANQSTTLISGLEATSPDKKKYILSAIERFLADGIQSDPLAYSAVSEKVSRYFTPTKKPKHERTKGGFNVVSGNQLTMMSLGRASLVSTDQTFIGGRSVVVSSKTGTKVTSNKSLLLTSKAITIGAETKQGEVPPAERVQVRAADRISLLNKRMGFEVAADAVQLGSRIPMTPNLAPLLPRVRVTASEAQVGALDDQGKVAQGLTVDAVGNVVLSATAQLAMQAGTAGVEVKGPMVSVAGMLKVGSALTVIGDAVMMPTIGVPGPPEGAAHAAAQSLFVTKQMALVGQATALQASLSTVSKTRSKGAPLPLNPLAGIAASAERKALDELEKTLRKQLALVRHDWEAMKIEATAFDVLLPITPLQDGLFEDP